MAKTTKVTKTKKPAPAPKPHKIKITIRSNDGHFIEANQRFATDDMLVDARKLANFITFGVRDE